MLNRFNNALDNMVRPQLRLAGRTVSMFQLCGSVGVALATFLAMIEVRNFGLSRGVMAVIVVGAVLTSLVLAMVTKIIMGEEWLVYYHHQLAAMIVIPIVLSLLHQPILPYLDLIFLGIGVFVVCGRIGCLMVGCCHGRPHSWGVCYRPEHAALGFPSYYVAVRLLPVQMIESFGACLIVTIGGFLILSNHRPGEAFAWYVVTYCLVRFCLEFLRGDSGRHHVLGFSESQWISFGLLCFVVWAEFAGLLIHHSWHLAAAVLMAVTMVGVFLTRRRRTSIKYGLRNPEHVSLVAETLERLSLATKHRTGVPWQPVTAGIPIECATLGIRISASRVQSPQGSAYLYGLSFHDDTMTQEEAATIAELVVQLKHPGRSNELIEGNRGVFHLLVHPVNGAPSGHGAGTQQSWRKQWGRSRPSRVAQRRETRSNAVSISSSDEDYSNPHLQAIGNLSEEAIPYIIEKLRPDKDAHFLIHALDRITNKRFTPPEIAPAQASFGSPLGNQGFAAMWADWGSKQFGKAKP